MNRSHFLPRKLEYLFSVDLDLGANRRGAGAARADVDQVLCSHAARTPNGARSVVYNALGETQVAGEPAISGSVEFVQEKLAFPPGREFGEISGRLVIRTPDNALIESTYSGVVRARQRWPLVTRDYGSLDPKLPEVETKAQLTTHFETGSAKYRWLTGKQCTGFGRMNLRGGEPTWASFDIYALAQ
ncbi:MAG TPA: DUF3237 family protein [Polyangiaceae bacterium]|jgi:hypothetical protein|nr:DUF3237 family protein [Polyangiaceae bacterium]